jgi:predicted PurR-regulated permease PerM
MSSDDLHNPRATDTGGTPVPPGGGLRWTALFAAVFLGVLAGIAAWYLLQRLYPVLVMAGVGFALAYLLDPLLHRLEKRGWARGQAVAVVAVGFLVVLAVGPYIVALLVGQVSTVVHDWQTYQDKVETWVNSGVVPYLKDRFPNQASQIDAHLATQVQNGQAWLQAHATAALGVVSTALLRSMRLLGYTFVTLFIALWAMMVIDPIRRRFTLLFSEHEAAALRTVDRQVTYMLGQYLRGMFLTCVGIALTDALLLQIPAIIFGTKFSLLLGALAGLAYLVPYVGMATTVVVTGLLAGFTADHSSLAAALMSVVVIIAVNQCFDLLVMPRIVGRKVGLHPLAIVLALLAGGALAGIWGMILATPLAATLKIILAQWVPVVATVPDVPEEKQPLVLDLGGFVAHTWGTVRGAEHKIEEHLPHPRAK